MKLKTCRTLNYNYNFNLKNGNFVRWGSTKEEDPLFSPVGPEILDLEISVGGCPNACKFCYKNNTNDPPTNMSFETFKNIFDKMPKSLTQIAFGITGVQTNPNFVDMLKYSRKHNVIPNFTLSGIDLTDDLAKEISKYIGGLAVSVYEMDKNIGYNAVKIFTDLGIKQTNIHIMVSEETLNFVYEVLRDIKIDKRLKNVNAIVFLGVKPKGRAKNKFTPLSYSKYKTLLNYCFDKNIKFGFDSCSAMKFEKYIRESNLNEEDKINYLSLSESCESFGLFSSYINVHGDYYPCSFAEGEGDWKNGISVVNCSDFLKDVWFSDKANKYRDISLNSCDKYGCRKCLIFDEINI